MMAAADIANALNGCRSGTGWMVRCPAHDDRTPSLSVSDKDGRVLVNCFAGCEQVAVIDALRRCGLWGGAERETPPPAQPRRQDRRKQALQIWREALPIADSPAARYLQARHISNPLPRSLRFHPGLPYTYRPAVTLPGMIAAVQNADGEIVAIQRTYLDLTGERKAEIDTPKKTMGAITGAAVRLAPVAATLTLTEGVEDAISLTQMTEQPVWAVLGVAGFKNFDPPPQVRTIILSPDSDETGENTVAAAAARFSAMGRRVLHLRPPVGCDWNDLLPEFNERAAIRQHDGGAVRAKADLDAFGELIGGTGYSG